MNLSSMLGQGGSSGQPSDGVELVDAGPIIGKVGKVDGPEVVKPQKYRVRSGGMFTSSSTGYRSTMKAGSVIDERYFNIESLQAQGIVLEPI